ncbi:MAG: septal ring lytic transglycosylase RlpA family protein [Polyangiaceae bacterium]
MTASLRRRALLAALLLVASGCGGARASNAAAAGVAGEILRGRASYYADSLAGRATASGQPYDPAAFTAAHRDLPFGTELEVTRDDGRSVRVRVNDRGPFGRAAARGVILDLSRAAAEQLDMIREGVIEVRAVVVSPAPAARSSRKTAR